MQKKIIIGFVLTLIIVIFIPVYWAMEPQRQAVALERQQAEAAERGAELYTSNCASCHGAQGEGTIGPALKGTQLDDKVLIKIISRGVPGTAMPAWGTEDDGPLKEHQVKDLVTFINNWHDDLPAAPVTESPAVTAPQASPETAASAIDAAKIFTNTCSGCHGQNREGLSGLAPALTPESLAGLTDDQVSDVIANGRPDTIMMGFHNTLSLDEIAALLQFLKYTSP